MKNDMMFEHDLAYLLDVLNMTADETEEQLDDRLRLRAKEVGVKVVEEVEVREEVGQRQLSSNISNISNISPLHLLPTCTPTYLSEYSRRSESIDSRASHSTGLTSHFSEERRPSRPSLSFRDYDAFLAKGKPNGRHSLSFSPNRSTFDLPLSHPSSPDPTPRRHFRRIRGLSMLRLSRSSDASSCPHCPPDAASQRRAVHKLPCGHRLCTQALRNTVRAATDTTRGSIPSCCGKPIPGSVVEAVMTQEEQAALLEKLHLWDDSLSLTPSNNTSRRTSAIIPRNFDSSRATSSSGHSQKEEPSPQILQEVERITALPEYTSLLATQISQRTRFLAWANAKRTALAEQHDHLRTAMRTAHESAVEDLAEHHAQALAEAEDKQVSAEAELREIHERECISSATALKHMETYCAGVYSNGSPHGRAITEQDMILLDNARRERDGMEGKHSSAINVLRGEQGRRIKLRGLRQDREAQELVRGQRMEELEAERGWSGEVGVLEGSLEGKRRRVAWRWELEMAVLAKRVAGEGFEEGLKLPTAGWGENDGGDEGTSEKDQEVVVEELKADVAIDISSTTAECVEISSP